jgi:predicted Fe-Mo cluster-binding NifX family protein
MKIAVSSTGGSLSAQVDPKFGRCAYFVIYDSGTRKFTAFSNPAGQAVGGAGTTAAREIAKRGTDVLLTGSVGSKAQSALQAAGIKIVTDVSGTVQSAVENYIKNQ